MMQLLFLYSEYLILYIVSNGNWTHRVFHIQKQSIVFIVAFDTVSPINSSPGSFTWLLHECKLVFIESQMSLKLGNVNLDIGLLYC